MLIWDIMQLKKTSKLNQPKKSHNPKIKIEFLYSNNNNRRPAFRFTISYSMLHILYDIILYNYLYNYITI